jgi:hypothetical protein
LYPAPRLHTASIMDAERVAGMAGFIEERQATLVAHCLDRVERGAVNGARHELAEWFSASFGELARTLREGAAEAPAGVRYSRAAIEHARVRHFEGDAIADMLVDCALLCDAICATAAREGLAFTAREFRTMNHFIDTAVASAAREFARLSFEEVLAHAARREALFAVELANASAVMRVAFTTLTGGRSGADGDAAELLDQGLRRVESLAAALFASRRP